MRNGLHSRVSVLLALTLPLSLFALGATPTAGKGEFRKTPPFRAIEMSGAGRLRILKGTTRSVELRMAPELLSHYLAQTRGDVLSLGFETGFAVSGISAIEVIVTLPDFTGLSLSGAVKAELGDDFRGRNFRLGLTGAGSFAGNLRYDLIEVAVSGSCVARLGGTAARLQVSISGAAGFEGDTLSVEEATVEASGGCRAALRVSTKLDVTASGASRISYRGDPRIQSRLSGAAGLVRSGDW